MNDDVVREKQETIRFNVDLITQKGLIVQCNFLFYYKNFNLQFYTFI